MARPTRRNPNHEKDEEFAEYEGYLDGNVWPSAEGTAASSGGYTMVDTEMAPQYAAAALCKLVRWARFAPVGETARYADEDAREEFVRRSYLGTCLAARACGMLPEHFHAIYGEIGPGADVEPRELLHRVVAIIEAATELEYLPAIELAAALLSDLIPSYRITERIE